MLHRKKNAEKRNWSVRIGEGRWQVAIFTGCQERCHNEGDISAISSYSLASLDHTKPRPEDKEKKNQVNLLNILLEGIKELFNLKDQDLKDKRSTE